MSPIRRALASDRLLRSAAWGQISLRDAGLGESPRLVEQVRVGDLTMEAALAVADRRRRLVHPSIVAIAAVEAVSDLGMDRAIRVEMAAPRGSALASVVAKAGRLSELAVATLYRDLLRAMQHAQSCGVALGVIGPDFLVLCPPGQEDLPPLRLVHAGLPALVAAARGQAAAAEHPGFETLHPLAEVVAPEVLDGGETSAASDCYAVCATMAWCALGRHVHAAALPAEVRSLAHQGVTTAMAADIAEWLPQLGPLVLRGLQAQPWARTGVIGELLSVCELLVLGRPTIDVDGRQVCAPWARGSPLLPLAAYGSSGWWSDRWEERRGERRLPGNPASAASSARWPARDPGAADLPVADRAKLRIALERLDGERARNQRDAGRRERQVWRLIGAGLALILVAGVVLALGMRQMREVGRDELLRQSPASRPGRPQVPPRPQPRMLTPTDGLGY